ncbi:MAG TPA: hypothetical protein VN181_07550 [Thermoanaerobaculia bacterium]|nr:hypothetical protein [Thermoanaerobaculia bacterium]
MAMEPRHFNYTIDDHEVRAELRESAGEWSAYVFVNPVNVKGNHDEATARTVMPKALRKLADEIKKM